MINQEKIEKIKSQMAANQEIEAVEMEKRRIAHIEARLQEALSENTELKTKVPKLEKSIKSLETKAKKSTPAKSKVSATTDAALVADLEAQLAEKDELIKRLQFKVRELEYKEVTLMRSRDNYGLTYSE